MKWLKQQVQFVFGNTDSAVGDRNVEYEFFRILRMDLCPDFQKNAAGFRKFDCVGQQVRQNLFQP